MCVWLTAKPVSNHIVKDRWCMPPERAETDERMWRSSATVAGILWWGRAIKAIK